MNLLTVAMAVMVTVSMFMAVPVQMTMLGTGIQETVLGKLKDDQLTLWCSVFRQ